MRLLFGLFLTILVYSCQSSSPTVAAEESNPAADGFDIEGSDQQAIELADSVMIQMGGRQAWDQTRFIRWTFFGRRDLLWDKQTGRVRIDVPGDSSVYLINIFDDSGQVLKQGEILEHPDSVKLYVDRGKSIWINDSYWLVLPYKLKDSGVTLTYVGEDTTSIGQDADVLELRFKEVGNTPQNKYQVYVEKNSRLISQWDFYSNAQDSVPRIQTPWANYKRYGDILLSGDRGRGKLENIAVYKNVPNEVFESFTPPDFNSLK